MNHKKQILLWLLFPLLLTAAFFLFRNNVLRWVFNREKAYISEAYHTQLNANDICFTGLRGIPLVLICSITFALWMRML
jgi:hypothetical protein